MSGPPEPIGLYEPFARSGSLVAVSAISPTRGGEAMTGKVGATLSFEQGREAARRAAENLLAVLVDAAGGDPAAVEQILLVRGHVNSVESYPDVHKVIDAASELLIERLGDRGRHARTAIGCAALPNDNAVTLEALAIVSPR